MLVQHILAGGLIKCFFLFPDLGKWSNFHEHIFDKGLKPPTSYETYQFSYDPGDPSSIATMAVALR